MNQPQIYPNESLLAGVDDLADAWFGLSRDNRRYGDGRRPAYYKKRAAIDLSSRRGSMADDNNIATASPVQRMLKCVDENWKRVGSPPLSDAAWKMRRACRLSQKNRRPETVLEKMVALLADDSWFNQVSTCSEHGRRIDLGRACGANEFEFIELKYGHGENSGTNHPLYAAIEIVKYALLYAHTRISHCSQPQLPLRPLLNARVIHLRVLAPAGYYEYQTRNGRVCKFEFEWLEHSLNHELSSLQPPVTYDFRFEKLTAEFEAVYRQPLSLINGVRAFQDCWPRAREPVFLQ
jgi:hypothetical protein